MTVPTIKSRPLHPGLRIHPHSRQHLFVLEGDGVQALAELVGMAGTAFLANSDVLFLAGAKSVAAHDVALRQVAARSCAQFDTLAELLLQLRAALAVATMGTRVYIAGTEGFIGQVLQVTTGHGMDAASVSTEHRGSRARRVQCVHCKAFMENVTHSSCTCSGCGLTLRVRDHYSRRLAAFQGVNADAEAPGTAAAPEEWFP